MSKDPRAYETAHASLVALGSALDRIGDLAGRVVQPPFPTVQRSQLEQLEHLVDQAVNFLAWEVLHADPQRPFFHRQNDLVAQWGGPNADNVYRHARIDPGRSYRIAGRMHTCDQFILALRAGFMHNEVWGTRFQIDAASLGIGPGDDFEILLGGDEPNAIPIPDGVIMASVREYYYAWLPEEPAVFTIECLDADDTDSPPGDELLAANVDRGIGQIEDSITSWNSYMNENRADRTDNSFVTATTVAKGLSNARYNFCFWDLAPDEALLVEFDVPDADYWSLQLYRMGTFELVDPYRRVSSRNQTQLTPSPDGRIRAIVAADDPGHRNWLDNGGRQNGLCTLRWFWPRSDVSPNATARPIALADVGLALGPGEPEMEAPERAREIAARRAHLRWRFRV